MNSSKVMSQYLVLSTPSLYALANLDSDFIAAIAAKNCAMEWRWKGKTFSMATTWQGSSALATQSAKIARTSNQEPGETFRQRTRFLTTCAFR